MAVYLKYLPILFFIFASFQAHSGIGLITEEKSLASHNTCLKIAKKLSSVYKSDCQSNQFNYFQLSVNNTPLLFKEHVSSLKAPLGDVLLIGGIHGDEYASVSIIFKWLQFINQQKDYDFNWHIIPLLNPDGLLQRPSKRINANNVDLNRNFPSHESPEKHLIYWRKRTHAHPRKFPGKHPLSEPESLWLFQLIHDIKPAVIISVHAPYGIVDFDGNIQNKPPSKLGSLNLHLLGTYPGSLGRYGQQLLKVPVMTIELKHAGIMPSKKEIRTIWDDLNRWLNKYFKDH